MLALNALQSYELNASYDDPRLISSAHSGQKMILDAPPLNGKVKMRDVYKLRGYGTVYDNLSQISGGQILYYCDSDIGKPFIHPLFDSSAVLRINYVDPMGTRKPHFYRDATKNCGPGLSFLADSQFQRNEIMASQLWQRNQNYPFYN